MNKSFYRIIFNARRGLRMAVAETARCGRQGATGDTRASRRKQNRPPALVNIAHTAINLVVIWGAALLLPSAAQAQIKADPRAPGTQQATVLTTANGAPQVNIQTPSAAGVSRNVFGQFDVQSAGAVLNNSRTGAASTVGGYVQANPWLAKGSARIILNEVNSSSTSQLQGPIEVAGQRAEVVIANPAGISVNGGSFINASTVTLTSGTPVLNNGALETFRVQGGSVSVGGHGLDTGGADYTTILARAVQVNAGIWAKELHVKTGVAPTSTQGATQALIQGVGQGAEPLQAGAPTTGIALDISTLGGMYAGRIFLIGTEAGMGVRNNGAINAGAGDITITNNGWLSNAGGVYASGHTRATTQGSQTHSGTTAAQGDLTLIANASAGGTGAGITATDKSTLAGGLKADGTLVSGGGGNASLSATQDITVGGNLAVAGDLVVKAPGVDLSGAHLWAERADITASAKTSTLRTDGATVVAKALNISAHSLSNVGGTLGQTGPGDLAIQLDGDLDNSAGHISGNANVTLGATMLNNANKGSVFAQSDLDITTAQLANGGSLYAQGNQTLHIGGDLSNTGASALIGAQGNTTITTSSLHNVGDAQIIAGLRSDGQLAGRAAQTAAHLSITAANGLNSLGVLMAAGAVNLSGPELILGGATNAGTDMALQGRSVWVDGSLLAGRNLDVLAQSQLDLRGVVQVGGDASVNAGAFNLGGSFSVSQNLGLQAGAIANTPGSQLSVGRDANLGAGASVNLAGSTSVGNRLSLSGTTIDITGPVDAGATSVTGGTIALGQTGTTLNWRGSLALDMSGDVTTRGPLSVLGDTGITSGGNVHIGGQATSDAHFDVHASGNVQIDGGVQANQGVAVASGGNLDVGAIQGSGVSLDAQTIQVNGAVIGDSGVTQLRATNGIAVTGNVVGAGGVVAVTTGALDIGGSTTSGAGLSLQAGTTVHLSGQAQATGSTHLQAGTTLVADQGLAGGAVDINAQDVSVAQNLHSGGVLQAQTHSLQVGGDVLSGGDMQLRATPQAGASGASWVNIGGALATNSALDVQTTGTLDVGGMASSAGNQSLSGASINVQGAQALGSMDLQASGGAITSTSSLLATSGLSANAHGAITVQGHIASDGATTLDSTGQVSASGTLASGARGLMVHAGSDIMAGAEQSLGNSQLTSSANITLGNATNLGSYTVTAGGNIAQAQVTAGAGLSESATGGISHSGATLVQGDAILSSGAGQTLGNTPASGLVATGRITATASSGSISVGADLLANGDISTTAHAGAISVGGKLSTQGTLGVLAQGSISVGGAAAVNGSVNTTSAAGGVAFNNNLNVGGSTTITAGNGITLGGNSTLVGTAQLQSASGTISNQGTLATNQTLTVSGNADLLNHGSLQSAGDMGLSAHNITSDASGSSAITTAGALTASASGSVNLASGVSVTARDTITLGAAGGGGSAANIQAGTSIALSGGTLANSGQIASQTISSSGSIGNTGTLYATTGVNVAGSTSNSGQIVAGTSVSLGSTSNSGVIQSETVSLGSTSNSGSIAGNSVSAAGLSNQGTVGANGDISISGDVNNSAAIAANNITFSGSLTNSGQVHASGNIAINASSVTNTAEVTAPILGVPENTTIPYAHSGAIKADGTLTLSGGSLSNTGTLSSGGAMAIAMTGSVANNKRGFIMGDSSITMAGGSVTNDGIVYGNAGAPSTITINTGGGFSNGSTGILIAGSQLNITASSFANAGDNVSAGVGSLGNATLATTSLWDAGANSLKVNGVLNAATAGINVGVGQTFEAANITWSGTLTNLGTTNLGIASGSVVNQSSGSIIRSDAPNSGALAGSYEILSGAPAGYSNVTFAGYTDVANRAQFSAQSFSGGLVNIAGDVSVGAAGAGYAPLAIAQTAIWSGVPLSDPTSAPVQLLSEAQSLPRANFTGSSIVNLVGPSAGTVVGGNVTVNAGDLTVDHSHTGAAQTSIGAAQGLAAGTVVGSPAALAAWSNPSLLNPATLRPGPQNGALSSATLSSTVGSGTTLGSAGGFNGNVGINGAAGVAPSTSAGGIGVPAPDLSSAQGAWAALMAGNVQPVVTDWAALNARGSSGFTSSRTSGFSGVPTNLNASVDNRASMQVAGEWVQLDSQGLAEINRIGIQAAKDKAKLAALTVPTDSTQITVTGGTLSAVHGDLAVDATGQLTLTNTQVHATEGVAHIYGSEGVRLAATREDITTSTTTEVVGGGVTTTTRTTSVWGTSSVDAKQIDIQSGNGSITIDSSDLSAQNGIRLSAAKDVNILAQKGIDTQTSSTATPMPTPSATFVNDEFATTNHAALDSTSTTTTTTTVKGSVIEGNSVVIQAGKDIDASAAQITAKASTNKPLTDSSGSVALLAGGNIKLRSAVNTTTSSSQELHIADMSNTDAARSSASSTDTRQTLAQSSISASNTVVLQADKRVEMSAVKLSGDKGVGISAKNGVTLSAIALNNQSSSTNTRSETNSANDIDGRVNAPIESAASQTQSSLTHAGSFVAAIDGNVTINAASNAGKGNLRVESGAIKAAGNVNLQGQDVTLTALQGHSQSQTTSTTTAPSGAFAWTSEQSSAQQSVRSSGATVEGAGNVSIIAATPGESVAGADGKTLLGGNATLQGANVQAGGDITLAGASVRVAANVDTNAAQASTNAANYTRSQTQTASGAQLQAGGKLDILAQANAGTKDASQGNIVLNGATVSAAGPATLIARRGDGQTQGQTGGGTITLGAVTLNNSSESASTSSSSGLFSSSSTVERHGSTDTLQKGSTLTANSISAQAAGDITATNAQLGAIATDDSKAGAVVLQSESGNVTLAATTDSHTRSDYRQSTSSGLFAGGGIIFGSRTSTDQSSSQGNSAGVSSYGGDTVTIASGKNITLTGTDVISDKGTLLSAKQDINIDALMTRSTTLGSHQTQQSGLGTSGIGLFLGTSQQANSTTTKTTTANGSTVGALGGNVTIAAGGSYTQTASSLQAPAGDITVTGQRIDILSAQQTQASHAEQSASSAGVSLTISNPVVSAAQGVTQTAQMAQATASVNDGRMKALGAATTALSASNTATQVAAIARDPSSASSIGISISLGSSSSQASQDGTQTSSAGSTVAAGGNVRLKATGAGQQSNITLQGSAIAAGKDVGLKADNQVNLLASADTATTANASESSGASIGVSFTVGSQSGFSITASATQASGNGQGSGTTHTASSIQAGNTATIQSGGDTAIVGSTVNANTVKADVGGKLTITSLQDKSSYSESSQSSGFGVSLCIPPLCYGASSASVSAGQSAIDSNYQGTSTTAGIKAGDGGFQVDVKGATTLTGGQITSTQAAQVKNLNTYASAGGTTATDLHNSASYNANAMSVSAGMSGTIGDQSSAKAKQDMAARGMTDKEIKTVVTTPTKPSGSAGVGQASGQAASTTVAAITGIAGNTSVRTGDADASVKPILDASQIRNDVNAQTRITASFGQMAPKAWADYADTQRKAALASGNPAEAAKWDEGGAYRIAGHAFLGAASGGTSGAAGAAASATVMPEIGKLIDATDLPAPVKAGLGMVTSAVIGNAVGGPTGAATAFNVDVNNRQLHPTEISWIKTNGAKFADTLSEQLGRPVSEQEAMHWLTAAGESDVDNAAQRSNGMFVRGTNNTEDAQAYDAAKSFIAINTKTNNGFVDANGHNQTLFTAKNGDFYKPEVYSQYRNDPQYRDYYWNVMGLNLKGDNMSPQEKAVYDQRQAVVNKQTVANLLTVGALVGTGKVVSGLVSKAETPGTSTTMKLTAEEEAAIAKAKIDNNFYAEGASSTPVGLTTSAGVIPANPNKTTTVLGRFNPDMQSTIDTQMQAPKSADFGARPGGFNVLNVDDVTVNAAGSQFFEKVNKPFLDAALKRGDDVALATVPKQKTDLIDLRTGDLKGNFAYEVDYLVKNNYKPVNLTQAQWDVIKGWFK